MQDIFSLPSPEEDSNNQQFFYLTLENSSREEAEEPKQPPDAEILSSIDIVQENTSESSLKLITLEDGRMFVTTDAG